MRHRGAAVVCVLVVGLFMRQLSLSIQFNVKVVTLHPPIFHENPSQSNETSSLTVETDNETIIPWSNLKVAIFMTTHLSQEHVAFLQNCWPAAIDKLPLLRDAHLILFTSGNVTEKLLKPLHFQTITIKRYKEYVPPFQPRFKKDRQKQSGAIKAMQQPFLNSNRDWFRGYDWVVRLNPDVLVRDDDWLRKTMLNKTVDAIVIEKWPKLVHTDFVAFRPHAVNKTELLNRRATSGTAEMHMYRGVEHLIQQGRVARLPHAQRIPETDARVVGKQSPVIHHHDLYKYCPNYFNATHGDFF